MSIGPNRDPQTTNQQLTKMEIIAKKIQEGHRIKQLIQMYPGLINKIKQMAVLRPPRTHVTKVLHLYGPPESGNLTT